MDHAPYVLCGVKHTDPVSLGLFAGAVSQAAASGGDSILLIVIVILVLVVLLVLCAGVAYLKYVGSSSVGTMWPPCYPFLE